MIVRLYTFEAQGRAGDDLGFARCANPLFRSNTVRAEKSMSFDEPQPNAAEATANSEKLSLPDRIFDLCRRGALPAQFRVNDVRQALGNEYAETYIRRALGLYSEKPGNYTYRWNKPRFRKVRHGVYELVS